ncbi:unnamed protein product [Ceutorhynchus assimilis]|uniref:Uncharacterized protein n=1 Tax=Ceutorhynchus assimilis TaxID=467358 RepID=A0A9N9MU37_9CUCU|nr:unnamed protein product [Ceutorhynchus assimilis]
MDTSERISPEPEVSNDLISLDDEQAPLETHQEVSDPPIHEPISGRRLVGAPRISKESWDYSNFLDSRSRGQSCSNDASDMSRNTLQAQNNNFASQSLQVDHNSHSQASFRASLPPTHSSHSVPTPRIDNPPYSLIDASLADLPSHLVSSRTSVPTSTGLYVAPISNRHSWLPSSAVQSSLRQDRDNTFVIPNQRHSDAIRQTRYQAMPSAEASDSRVRFAEPENFASSANSTQHETLAPTDPVPGSICTWKKKSLLSNTDI